MHPQSPFLTISPAISAASHTTLPVTSTFASRMTTPAVGSLHLSDHDSDHDSEPFPQWLRKAAEKILYTHSMHPPPICMAACADLPPDLKYAAWAELKGRASAQLLLK